MKIRIADHEIDIADAARWLAEDYPPATVRYYDYAGKDSLEAARSPTDRVTVEDLGRLVCIGASLNYKRGHTLLADSHEARWPTVELSDLSEREEEGDAFYEHPDVDAIITLFEFWEGRHGLAYGTIGKLLHIKWPSFMPVTDREFRNVYRDRAVAEHNRSDLIQTVVGSSHTRTKSANIRAYLKAFRDDLLVAGRALSALRQELDTYSDPSGGTEVANGHVERLTGLSNVRLMDALTWGINSDGKLPG